MFLKQFLLLILVVEYGGNRANASNYNEYGKNPEELEGQQQKLHRQDDQSSFRIFERVAMLFEPMIFAIESLKCRDQMKTFSLNLSNSSLWAVQMLDASAKSFQNLLTSDSYDLGNFDECLDVNLNREVKENILGRYCLAKLFANCSKPGQPKDVRDLKDSILEQMIVYILRHGFKNNYIQIGVCFPHECSATDVQNMLRFLYNNITKINCEIEVQVLENGCTDSTEYTESIFDSLISCIFSIIFFGVVLVTIIQLSSISYKFRLPAFFDRFILPFSAYRNYKYLETDQLSERILVIDFLKVYSLILLTVLRRFELMIKGPILNRRYVDKVFNEDTKNMLSILTEDTIVITFLVISGFLHHKKIREECLKKNSEFWRISFLQLLKSIPLLTSAISFFAFEYYGLGSGPFWKEKIKQRILTCKDALMKVNLSEIIGTCIFESWYFVAVPLHFLFFTSFIVSITMKSSTTGWTILGLLTVVAYLTMPEKPIHIKGTSVSGNGEVKYLDIAIMQAFPYLIGIISFGVYNMLKEKRKLGDLRKFQVRQIPRVCKLLALNLALFILFYAFAYDSYELTIFKNDKWRRTMWSFIVSWVIFKGSLNDKSQFSWALKHKYLAFFGSFTYPYILTLGLIQNYMTATARNLEYFSLFRLIWMSLADVLFTSIFAFVFYMIIHKPLSVLLEEKILKARVRMKKIERGNKKTKKVF